MTPEERYRDAVEAVHEWRDEMREHADEVARPQPAEVIWLDTGSSPGYERRVPREG